MADQENDLDDARMPFTEHLRELRDRLRNSVIALIGGFAIAYAFKEDLFVLLVKPLLPVLASLHQEGKPVGEGSTLYFNSAIEPFWTYFGMSLWAGLFIASPFVFHQIWKFIAPGLYKQERYYGLGFAIASAGCFVGGAVFCYNLVLPQVLQFLVGFATTDVARQGALLKEAAPEAQLSLVPLLTMSEYLSFTRKLLLGFGVIFELPLLIFFLAIIGAVTHRGLWAFNRWWAVLSFIIAAALTPPDVISQLMMAGPLIVLYNISIGIAYFVTRGRESRERALERTSTRP